MLRKIKIYGELSKIIGHKEFDNINVANISQAVSFLINNFPQIESHMATRQYKVKVGDYTINKQELDYPIGKQNIHFIPVIQGSGGGVGRVIGGAALIGLAVVTGGGSALFTKAGFAAAGFGTKAALGIGAGLVLSGVSEMLFPMPKQPEFSSEQDPRLSFSFSGTQQTSRAGTPVPIVYGEIFTGSVVISGGVDTEQVQA